MSEPELSAIVLCYQAGDPIRRLLSSLERQLEESGVDYEMVLVANHWAGGDDPTPEIVKEWARARERARPVVSEKQGGMGWDMISGFSSARGRYMVAIDGDEQNPVDDVLKMYSRMKETGAEVMKGRRTARFDGPYRRFVSFAYNILFLALFRTRGLWDINGKPKGMTREAWERIEVGAEDWFIDAEIVLAARRRGLRVVEMPVVFHRNDERASFVKPGAILEFIRNMARARTPRG